MPDAEGMAQESNKDSAMKTLTSEQISRQDFVDNSIFELLQSLNPSIKELEWDIEMIGEVRDCIAQWLVDQLKVTDEMSFYPFIEE